MPNAELHKVRTFTASHTSLSRAKFAYVGIRFCGIPCFDMLEAYGLHLSS
jgi:hypothetical protein